MRRLSTSAIDTIDEHNRLIVRTPLTTPEVALEHSSVQAHRGQLSPPRYRLRHGWLRPFRSAANREVTGQEQCQDKSRSRCIDRDRSRSKAFPRPDRLGHLLSRARFDMDMENPRRRSPHRERPRARLARAPLSRSRHRGGPPLESPREREPNPLHPRCLPSTSLPQRGWGPASVVRRFQLGDRLGPAPLRPHVPPGSTPPRIVEGRLQSVGI